MGKKVLVRSRYRQPLVRTTRDWERGKDGKLQEVNGYRQFENHHAYMTPKEAAFIIDSEENQLFIDAGLPPVYYYPAGAPLIVDDSKDGTLSPPLAQSAMVANSPRQAEAARRALAEAEVTVAAREADTRDKVAAQRASRGGGAKRIATPVGEEDDTANFEKPRKEFASDQSGAVPRKLSNPDLGDDEVLSEAPTFS
jgi:hypothetical protein